MGAFLAAYGVIAIFVVMLLKEIGIPVPVPSDLLMVGAGVQIASGSYGAIELTAALAIAVLVGGSIQFLLARSAGRAVVYRLAFVPFAVATVAGSLVFYGWHVALGYVVGPAAGALVERYAALAIGALVALAAVGALGWYLLRRRGTAARSWTEAACPACLAVTALRR